MEEFDIFLSHHSSDKPWVIALKAALTARGVKVWLDQDEIRPGDLYIDALERGVEVSRCVAVVISLQSSKSRWMKEEYGRALQLFNSRERDVRIIPCLLKDADLPGFLATRHYVDFRDQSRFEDGVDRLHRAILPEDAPEPPGQPAKQAAPAILTSAEVSPLELKYLDRWIAAVRKERSTLLIVRSCAPVLGLLAAWLTGGTDYPLWGFGGAAAVTGLLGVAATARPWSTRSLELQQLATQRDALELCSQEFRPVCPDVVNAFNRLLKRRIGIEPDAREVRV